VISGTAFYRSNDPSNSVKALKEDKIPKGYTSMPPGPPHRATTIRHAVRKNKCKIHKHKRIYKNHASSVFFKFSMKVNDDDDFHCIL